MYKRILIVVDGRPVSRAALREGLALAKNYDAEVVLFTVLPRYSVPVTDAPPFAMVSLEEFQEAARANARKWLAAASAMADKVGVMSRSSVGSGEDDARCIAEAARKRRCNLIVVASEGRNALLRLLTGSVIPGLITSSPVPVLVCKERPRVNAGERAAAQPRRTAARATGTPPAL